MKKRIAPQLTSTSPIHLPADPIHRDFCGAWHTALQDVINFGSDILTNACALNFLLPRFQPIYSAGFEVKIQRASVL